MIFLNKNINDVSVRGITENKYTWRCAGTENSLITKKSKHQKSVIKRIKHD